MSFSHVRAAAPDVPDDDDDGPPAEPPPPRDPALDPTLADVVVAAAALLLLIANAPELQRGSPVLLAAVAWPLGAVGLVGLGILVHRRDRAAIFGAAFLGWALLSVAFSGQANMAWNAGWSGDRGWVYLAAYLGIWAIGRRRGSAGARLVGGALRVGHVAHARVAYIQAATPNGTGLISLADGRAMGFTLNPVMLGALMSGGVAMLGARAGRGGRWWWGWLALVVVLAVAGNMAGSRIGLVGMVVLAPLAAGLGARPRAGGGMAAIRAAAVLGAVLVGMFIGSLALPLSASGRLGGAEGTSSGTANRAAMWKAGAEAVVEKPVLGWGPNRFRSATNERVTRSFVLHEGPDRTFADAHNLIVELAVTTGLPGLALAGAFAWFAARRARGPLAWYAAGVGLTWLFEPFAVATAPTALLALGLAAVATDPPVVADPPLARRGPRVASHVLASVLGVLALATGARLVYADHLLAVAQTDPDPTDVVRRANQAWPGDPGLVDLYARQLGQDALLQKDPALARRALAQSERAVELEPRYWYFWSELGASRQSPVMSTGKERYRRAREAYLEAQRLSPWSQTAMTQLYLAAIALDRPAEAARWRERLCAIDACPPAPR
ncbi:MAG: O-antigen ligase family protein [Acidimicrobiales bacterium]